MKRFRLTMFFTVILFSLLNGQNKESYFIVAESFKEFGSWRIDATGTFGYALLGTNPRYPVEKEPAVADFTVEHSGTYRLWVHARDFKSDQGRRFFKVAINNIFSPVIFGQHGDDAFLWTDGGLCYLNEGVNTISLIDASGYYARCDGIFLTKDTTQIPPEDFHEMTTFAEPLTLFKDREKPFFPQWANNATSTPIDKLEIKNDEIKIVFYKFSDSKNGDFIQNEIFLKYDNVWIKVKDRTDDHGFLMMKALSSDRDLWVEGYPLFKQKIENKTGVVSSMTFNVYGAGVPAWLIPMGMEQLPDKRVKLIFEERDDVALEVFWELDSIEVAPKISLNAKIKKPGDYSFCLFSGKEYDDALYENALAPFRIMEKRVPEEPFVFLEHYLFTPMGSVTLHEENNIVPGKKLTTAVIVDPDCLPRGYVYRETSKFGVCMRGPRGGVRGNIFAPLFGSKYAVFNAGDTYTISYRIVNTLDTWFNTYKYITENIFNVHDYRSNYYTSLNEAIYNTTDLMLDNDYGGWDPVDKAHYNMEEKDLTSVANPMTAIQRYLLTENESILKERVIPTIASLLTRYRLHFKRFDSRGGANYLGGISKPTKIGEPISGYNFNVFGGLYKMTRGLTPSLYKVGIDKAHAVTNLYGNIPTFSNDLALYDFTSDPQYLASAKDKADTYLKDVVYGEKYNSELPPFRDFINISYFPNLASLLDIYEVTKEQKYLDAAVKTGQMLATSLWVPGIDGDKGTEPYIINPSETLERAFMEGHNFWWHGSEQWRLGNKRGEVKPPKESLIPLKEEIVPGWLPARVGLGLEQASTFGDALNIYMNTWAGDMMKLSAYSGERYFETVAKNAIIGRFGNYAGYYQNRYISHQMKPNYPYTGPDLTSIYWHHIPPFLAMLEDFLINQVYVKSEGNIKFPSVRQQGYAYFNSNHYGFESGQFYEYDNMWLWNDRGIIYPDAKQINYLPARRDSLLAIALLNEDHKDVSTRIRLGEKVVGGDRFSGEASVFREDGSNYSVNVIRGHFDINIPAKGMRSVVMHVPQIRSPQYSSVEYKVNDVKNTEAVHDRGKAYLLQVSPRQYSVYVYITDMPDETKEMTVTYKIGDEKGERKIVEYPYEAIIDVDDVSKSFSYDIEVKRSNNRLERIKGNILKPLNL